MTSLRLTYCELSLKQFEIFNDLLYFLYKSEFVSQWLRPLLRNYLLLILDF